MKFTKMHGCGNDYIYINCFEETVLNPNDLAIKLSDRHFGIGGDGVVLIVPSEKCDALMRMFNADGSEGKMCGNAIRCVAKYLYDNDIVKKDVMTIDTLSGVKTLQLDIKDGAVNTVSVSMGKASFVCKDIPVTFEKEEFIDEVIFVLGDDYIATAVSVGNPHIVILHADVSGLDLDKIGPHFENYHMFPERINTEFVELIDSNTVKMRVYERGSGETLACGTGACAVVSALVKKNILKPNEDIKVLLTGGELIINISNDFDITMKGSATTVFKGEI